VIWRAIKSVLAVLLGWLVVTHLPDLARYLRMREM
jgi:hypothetical protein